MEESALIRCAIVTNVLTPYRIHFHQRLAREIAGLELTTLTTRSSADLPWDNNPAGLVVMEFTVAEQTRILPRLLSEARTLRNILRFLRVECINVLVVNGYNDALRLGLISLAPLLGIRVLLWADSNLAAESAKPQLKRMSKRALLTLLQGPLSGVMAIGSNGRGYFENYMKKPPPIFNVPCDVDSMRFAGRDVYDHSAACRNWNFDPHRKRVLFVGRLAPIKGVEVLIESFASFASLRQSWDLVIAGKGPLEQQLRRLVPNELGSRVHWTGFVDHDLLPQLYAACDAFALPSRSEAWGVALTEALSSGLPFVATDVVGAALEILKHREGAGILVPPDDPKSLSRAIHDLTEPKALKRHSAQAAEAFQLWRSRSDPVVGFSNAIDHVLSR